MAIDFPASPTVGQTFTSGGRTWVYSSGGTWDVPSSSTLPFDLKIGGSFTATNYDVAGKNKIINGAMEICQRGTGSWVAGATSSSNGFLVDRWQCYRAAFAAGSTMFQQTTSSLTGFINALQYRRTSGDTSTATMYMSQTLETRTSVPLAGQLVTLSFYARIGTNFSGSNLVATVITGTGTDQNVTVGLTGLATAASLTIPVASLTATWQQFTVTGLVASTAKQVAVQFSYNPTGTAGTEDTFDITGVQLERGSVATPFSRAGGTIQGELAACQRYYWRWTGTEITGNFYTASNAYPPVFFPVTMRQTPSIVGSGNVRAYYSGTSKDTTGVAVLNGGNASSATLTLTFSGAPASTPANFGPLGYVEFNAEI